MAIGFNIWSIFFHFPPGFVFFLPRFRGWRFVKDVKKHRVNSRNMEVFLECFGVFWGVLKCFKMFWSVYEWCGIVLNYFG